MRVAMAWERCDVVALDSQGAIPRVYNLMSQAPRSWIEETLARQMMERLRTLMWVKRHGGVAGNEEADRKAKMDVWMKERMCRPDIVTPAGIRQAFPISTSETASTFKVGKDRDTGVSRT